MQKKFLAAVIAGLVAAPAFADDSVTLYGLIDAGLSYRSDNYKGNVASRSGIDAGQANGSRLGVRGTEQIAPDLKAFFVIEAGINADTGTSAQSGLTWGRQVLGGLDVSGYKLAFGRQYSPAYNLYSALDPFGVGTVGQVNNIFTHILARADNAVTFSTPVWGNVLAIDTIYSINKAGGETLAASGTDTTNDRYVSVFPKVTFNKDFVVQAGYTQDKVKAAAAAKTYIDLLAGYDLKVVKFDFAYARVEDGTSKVNGEDKKWDRFHVGLKAPFGATTLLASVSYSKDKNGLDDKAQQYAIGGAYAFSKRTDLYLAYSQILTSDGADAAAAKVTDNTKYAYTVSDGSNNGLGYRRGLNFGLRHRF